MHRLPHAKSGSVFAYRAEIDEWWRGRSARLSVEAEPDAIEDLNALASRTSPEQPAGPHRRWLWPALGLFATAVAVVAMAWSATLPSSSTVDSLAVLPFENARDDENAAYLSDGITEHLTNALAQTPNLRVTARPHAYRYKGPDVDAQQAGHELGVQAVLTGRVAQRDDLVRLQIDLIEVENGTQIWGKQFERKFADILTLQDEVAREVSERLSGSRPAVSPASRRTTKNTDAYEAYLKGRYLWNRRTEDSIRLAVAHFEDALKADPDYALAAAGLADCYAVYSIYQLETPHQSGPRARAAAIRALQLDDTMAAPHAALGFVKTHYDWDWKGAEKEFQRSIELDPQYANAHFWYAVYLSAVGRTDESVAALRRAQQLDPVSLIIRAGVGGEPGLYAARRYDEAIAQIKTAVELDPGFAAGRLWLGMPYVQKGMYREAIAEMEQALTLSADSPLMLGPLGHAYAVAGEMSKANQALARLEQMARHRYVSPFDRALVHLGLGHVDRAFAWLEKAFVDRSYRMHWLKVDPRFDRLRADARFSSLLRRMGLEP
ncbi:MAG TPA: tetratricopeptide repeat protein [Vicinamibacterales bacterium]|nr:tetratricopeptide repeat protein [Vicinamibacterales bacterium]